MMITGILSPASATRMPIVAVSAYAGRHRRDAEDGAAEQADGALGQSLADQVGLGLVAGSWWQRVA